MSHVDVAEQLMLPFPELPPDARSFDARVDALLEYTGTAKGYDGPRGQLFAFCHDLPHPLGEIVYKVIRYHRKGNPEDLVKIAGWAKLIWQQRHQSAEVQPEPQTTSRCT